MSWFLITRFFLLLFGVCAAISLTAGLFFRKDKTLFSKLVSLIAGVIALQIAIIFIVAPFIIHVFLFSEQHFYPYPEIDTIFAPGFTVTNFEKVEKNMTKGQVEDLLGKPLADGIGVGNDRNCWKYSADGKAGPHGDFSYYMYLVCFQGEIVYTKVVHEFFD
ncbi:MAG TPA: hypothetical protein VD999_07130 [Vitreimonas sp.]|nr:hypothetical protein [Vitreimonas sp.]